MPWKECSPLSSRTEFCRLAVVEGVNIRELCERFSISRKTGYKWLQRYRESGDAGLADRSRRPQRMPLRSSSTVEQQVLAIRTAHPAWGGRKIRRRLTAQGQQQVPAASTITAILHRHKLITPQAGDSHGLRRFEREAPNDLWQMDFKGHFPLTAGRRCHPLTVLDDYSRFALGLSACANEQRATVVERLQAIFRRYGLPRQMLMDNGPPWGASTVGELTGLSVWLMDLDVEVLHGRPHHPQTQGKCERFHRTLKREVLQGRTFGSLQDVQRTFDPWREVYNHERPHEALDLAVPSSRYQVSHRTYCETTRAFEYDPSFEVRRVDAQGRIMWGKTKHFFCGAFAGRQLGLRSTDTDGQWAIYYRTFRVGLLDLGGQAAGGRGGEASARLALAEASPPQFFTH